MGFIECPEDWTLENQSPKRWWNGQRSQDNMLVVFFPCNQLIGGGKVSWRQITEIDNQHHLPFNPMLVKLLCLLRKYRHKHSKQDWNWNPPNLVL